MAISCPRRWKRGVPLCSRPSKTSWTRLRRKAGWTLRATEECLRYDAPVKSIQGIGFLESGGGWLPGRLDRMDRHFEDRGFNDTNIRLKPSEYFKRQGWISFEPVEGSLTVLADYIGPEKILWATDYPPRWLLSRRPRPHCQAPGAVGGHLAEDSGSGGDSVL